MAPADLPHGIAPWAASAVVAVHSLQFNLRMQRHGGGQTQLPLALPRYVLAILFCELCGLLPLSNLDVFLFYQMLLEF